jgi:hypothetical protein
MRCGVDPGCVRQSRLREAAMEHNVKVPLMGCELAKRPELFINRFLTGGPFHPLIHRNEFGYEVWMKCRAGCRHPSEQHHGYHHMMIWALLRICIKPQTAPRTRQFIIT